MKDDFEGLSGESEPATDTVSADDVWTSDVDKLRAERDAYKHDALMLLENCKTAQQERDHARRELWAYRSAVADVPALNDDEGVRWACRKINQIVDDVMAANDMVSGGGTPSA